MVHALSLAATEKLMISNYAPQLRIYNSLSGEKETFVPLVPDNVGMYVCGPTVYSNVHLGNCRTFISFDLVFRYLSHLGYKVRYVRNITDAGHLENDGESGEDPIARKARIEQIEPMEVVQKYTVDFHQILERFNNRPPSIEPTATGHIVEQIELIKEIIDAGYGYEKNGSVYFDVIKYNADKEYGKLSGRKLEDMITNTRELAAQSDKKNPQDFALWKKAEPEHIMRWPSPWSDGFPGWHLECTVMSTKYLGEQFDIHGGGMDLKFPHHECEIAQAQAVSDKAPVRYWMHANMLTLNGKKMSKSTGNNIMPRELFSGDNDNIDKGYSANVARFFMLQAHYRSILDFSNGALAASEKGYQRLMDGLALLADLDTADTSSVDIEAWKDACYAALNDDFNSPILIAQLFEALRMIHSIAAGKDSITTADKATLQKSIQAFLFDVLGLRKEQSAGSESNAQALDSAMQLIIELRSQARASKDWATSDVIRDRLGEAGIQLKDGKDGTTYSVQ